MIIIIFLKLHSLWPKFWILSKDFQHFYYFLWYLQRYSIFCWFLVWNWHFLACQALFYDFVIYKKNVSWSKFLKNKNFSHFNDEKILRHKIDFDFTLRVIKSIFFIIIPLYFNICDLSSPKKRRHTEAIEMKFILIWLKSMRKLIKFRNAFIVGK